MTTPRWKFDYYMRVGDDDTQKLSGHTVQISSIRPQLETTASLPLEKEYSLRLELIAEKEISRSDRRIQMPERRTTLRRKFDYSMRVDEDDTQKLFGHAVQICAIGPQLETTASLPLEKDYSLRLELIAEKEISHSDRRIQMPERRTTPRRKFDYYMRVDDDDTQKLLGHMVQVSAIGLQLETTASLPLEKDYYLRLELTAELADHPFIIFLARTKWCRIDDILPNLFHVGFQIKEIMPEDHKIILDIIKKYGS